MNCKILQLILGVALCTFYDPKNHHSGKELEYAIRLDGYNTPKPTIFVIMWYSSIATPAVLEYNNRNRSDIQYKLNEKDNYSWSTIDMSIPSHVGGEDDYSDLYRKINGRDFKNDSLYLNTTGPIVNVISRMTGVKITGRGIADEVAD